jgi:hypothetical protein
MTVAMLEKITILEPIPEPIAKSEIFTLSPSAIDRILAEDAARPKKPADPCLIEGVSEGFSDEPITEYQDSCDSAGLYYW